MVNRSCVCLRDKESVMHLLIYGVVAKELWNAVLVSWGMSWVFLAMVVEFIQEWYGGRVGRRRRKLRL